MSRNPITERTYYRVKVKTGSPVSVGSGAGLYTDADVLRNGSDEVFIPGTSLAGALRSANDRKENQKNSYFGFSLGEDGRMSSLFISDLYFHSAGKTAVRDGVRLGEEKEVENGGKFDYQVLDAGETGYFDIEVIHREKDTDWNEKADSGNILMNLLKKINAGEVRFGAKKNRGMGKLTVTEVTSVSFSAESGDAWLDFLEDRDSVLNKKENKIDLSKIEASDSSFVAITVPLKLDGGIIIRRYLTKSGESDYEHITANGKPVVPGSSWCGAIRADAARILKEAGVKGGNALIEKWFGHADDEDPKKSEQSLLVVEESVIKDSKALSITRNSIDRVSAATMGTALYTETVYFGGSTELRILVRKEDSYQALVELLGLVIRDIQEGFLPVGGEVSVGRGIFCKNGEVEITGNDKTEISALYECIRGSLR